MGETNAKGMPVTAEETANKEVVVSFYDLAFAQRRPAEAAEKYIGPVYIQHNPHAPDGVEPFIQVIAVAMRDAKTTMKRALAEGDKVFIHSHVTNIDPAMMGLEGRMDAQRGIAVMDIFRLEEQKIVEHWDVFMPVPEHAANDNTPF
jgi:predicted SnoaL-like aldol condensation-catalyzing enzyme